MLHAQTKREAVFAKNYHSVYNKESFKIQLTTGNVLRLSD